MSDMSRGEFLGVGAAALATGFGAGCVGSPAQSAPGGTAPDLVVVNGRVLTSEPSQPVAEAFAVKHDRFVAVGSTDDVTHLAGPNTEVIDAVGMTVTPGFIDAHSHPVWGGLQALVSVDTNLGRIARIQAALSARAGETPTGEWVVGFMYDDTKLSEGRPLSRRDLAEAVSDHPVYVGTAAAIQRSSTAGLWRLRA